MLDLWSPIALSIRANLRRFDRTVHVDQHGAIHRLGRRRGLQQRICGAGIRNLNPRLHERVAVGAGGAFAVQWEHVVQVVLIQQMACGAALEQAAHVAIRESDEVGYSPLCDKVSRVGIVFDVRYHFGVAFLSQ